MPYESVHVRVVFALPNEQHLFDVELPEGATIEQAIQASGVLGWYPEIDLRVQKVGVFGQLATMSTKVNNGDRIEIYRPCYPSARENLKKRQAKADNPEHLAPA